MDKESLVTGLIIRDKLTQLSLVFSHLVLETAVKILRDHRPKFMEHSG